MLREFSDELPKRFPTEAELRALDRPKRTQLGGAGLRLAWIGALLLAMALLARATLVR